MSISFDQLNLSLQNLLVNTGDTDYTQIFPQAIAYAENRLYRELDLLSTRTSDASVNLIAGVRTATCPPTISVVEGVSILTPVGQTVQNSKRNVLERVSLDFCDYAYGQESVTAQPEYFSMKSDTLIVFAASPNSAYTIEVTGTAQPIPMSISNPTSYLGNNFQDLLLSACMIFMSAWQRDNGSPANPQDANLWSTAYDMQFKSALEIVQRQKSQDPNWTPFTPTPLSAPRT